MRTLRIDLDQHLLAAAADIMGTADSNATVNEALRRIVVHERQLRNLERLMADSVFTPDRPSYRAGAAEPDSERSVVHAGSEQRGAPEPKPGQVRDDAADPTTVRPVGRVADR